MARAPPDSSGTPILLKIVLTGESGAGKTNILSQFVRSNFNPNAKTTIGVECAVKALQIGGTPVKAQIWDTAGQERFRAITSTYYHGAQGALLVYDITNTQSFRSAPRWLQELRNFADPNIPVVLVGNKCDLEASRSVTQEEGIRYAEAEHLLFFETSAKTAVNLNEAFTALVTEIVDSLKKGGLSASQTSISVAPGPGIIIEEERKCC
jgi:Ras-related protein Rab-11A